MIAKVATKGAKYTVPSGNSGSEKRTRP